MTNWIWSLFTLLVEMSVCTCRVFWGNSSGSSLAFTIRTHWIRSPSWCQKMLSTQTQFFFFWQTRSGGKWSPLFVAQKHPAGQGGSSAWQHFYQRRLTFTTTSSMMTTSGMMAQTPCQPSFRWATFVLKQNGNKLHDGNKQHGNKINRCQIVHLGAEKEKEEKTSSCQKLFHPGRSLILQLFFVTDLLLARGLTLWGNWHLLDQQLPKNMSMLILSSLFGCQQGKLFFFVSTASMDTIHIIACVQWHGTDE